MRPDPTGNDGIGARVNDRKAAVSSRVRITLAGLHELEAAPLQRPATTIFENLFGSADIARPFSL